MTQRSGENLEFYERGMAAFQAADWQAAIDAFEQLQAREGFSPELERLIDDARFKIGVERAGLPPARPMKQPRNFQAPKLPLSRWRPIAIGTAVVAVIALVVAIVWNRGIAPATVAAEVIQPLLAAMAERTEAAVQTFTTQPVSGTLELRWADNQAPLAAAPNLEIILDASGSMLAHAGDERRIVVAQRALRTLVEQLPEQTNTALRVYGSRRTKDCSDTELVRPLGQLDRAALIDQIETTKPVPEANTPLALSLQAVAEDMRDAQGDVLILVVSDGEDTCDGNPVQAVADLRAAHPNMRVSVVGFSVGPEQWRKQLQDAAAQGGGAYFDAATPEQLSAAVTSAAAVQVHVLDANSQEVARGTIDSPLPLPVGAYNIVVDGQQTGTAVEIRSTATTTIEAYQQEGTVLLRAAEPR